VGADAPGGQQRIARGTVLASHLSASFCRRGTREAIRHITVNEAQLDMRFLPGCMEDRRSCPYVMNDGIG